MSTASIKVSLSIHCFMDAVGKAWSQIPRVTIDERIPAGIPAVAFAGGVAPFRDGHDMDKYCLNDLRDITDQSLQVAVPIECWRPAIVTIAPQHQ